MRTLYIEDYYVNQKLTESIRSTEMLSQSDLQTNFDTGQRVGGAIVIGVFVTISLLRSLIVSSIVKVAEMVEKKSIINKLIKDVKDPAKQKILKENLSVLNKEILKIKGEIKDLENELKRETKSLKSLSKKSKDYKNTKLYLVDLKDEIKNLKGSINENLALKLFTSKDLSNSFLKGIVSGSMHTSSWLKMHSLKLTAALVIGSIATGIVKRQVELNKYIKQAKTPEERKSLKEQAKKLNPAFLKLKNQFNKIESEIKIAKENTEGKSNSKIKKLESKLSTVKKQIGL